MVKDDIDIIMDINNNFYYSTPEYEMMGIYENKISFRSTENSKYGLMDMDGEIIIEPQYDLPLEFSEGLSFVTLDGEDGFKVGFINIKGELVIDYLYDWACSFRDGLASVGIENQRWFIDTDGEAVSGPYEFLDKEVFNRTPAYMDYYDGYTAFLYETEDAPYLTYGGKGYWGFLDKDGNVAIPPQYINVRPFNEGLAAVQTKDKDWIYIDKNGNKVMDGDMGDFKNGIACIGGKFINKSGNVVCEVPEGYFVEASYSNGLDNFHYGLIVISLDSQNFLLQLN